MHHSHKYACCPDMHSSGLLTMLGGLLSLKEQGHPLSEAVVPDAVDNDITATVSCQNPEGKKGKVTPGVSHHISEHKHCNGGEGCCEGKRQDANCLCSLDVGEGGSVRASSSSRAVAQTPF